MTHAPSKKLTIPAKGSVVNPLKTPRGPFALLLGGNAGSGKTSLALQIARSKGVKKVYLASFDGLTGPMAYVPAEVYNKIHVSLFLDRAHMGRSLLPTNFANVEFEAPDWAELGWDKFVETVMSGIWTDGSIMNDWGPDTILIFDHGRAISDSLERSTLSARLKGRSANKSRRLTLPERANIANKLSNFVTTFVGQKFGFIFITQLKHLNLDRLVTAENAVEQTMKMMEKSNTDSEETFGRVGITTAELYPAFSGKDASRKVAEAFPIYLLASRSLPNGEETLPFLSKWHAHVPKLKLPLTSITEVELQQFDIVAQLYDAWHK